MSSGIVGREEKKKIVPIMIIIDEKGYVVDSKILKSNPLLDRYCKSAAVQCTFTPGINGNKPVKVRMTINYEFGPDFSEWTVR